MDVCLCVSIPEDKMLDLNIIQMAKASRLMSKWSEGGFAKGSEGGGDR